MGEGSAGEQATTTIDSMVELIKAKGKIDVTSIAVALDISPAVVEDWARVLESGNMVKITHEVGKMFVAPMNVGKEEAEEMQKKLEMQMGTLNERLDVEKLTLDKITDSIKKISSATQEVDKEFEKGAPGIHKALSEIAKLEKEAEKNSDELIKIKNKAASDYELVNKKFSELSSKMASLTSGEFNVNLTANQQKVEAAVASAHAKLGEIDAMRKEKDRALDELRKSMQEEMKKLNDQVSEFSKSANKEFDDTKKAVEEQIKLMHDQINEHKKAFQELHDLSENEKKITNTIKEDNARFNDLYNKINKEMDNLVKSLEGKKKESDAQISAMKEKFGQASEIFDTIERTKNDTEEASKRVAELSKELTKISEQLSALSTLKELKSKQVDEKMQIVSALSKKDKKVDSNIKDLEKKLSRSAKRIQGEKEVDS